MTIPKKNNSEKGNWKRAIGQGTTENKSENEQLKMGNYEEDNSEKGHVWKGNNFKKDNFKRAIL